MSSLDVFGLSSQTSGCSAGRSAVSNSIAANRILRPAAVERTGVDLADSAVLFRWRSSGLGCGSGFGGSMDWRRPQAFARLPLPRIVARKDRAHLPRIGQARYQSDRGTIAARGLRPGSRPSRAIGQEWHGRRYEFSPVDRAPACR